MDLNTVIFDMDGLLIDSEPLWRAAAVEVFAYYGKKISHDEYAKTTGLRSSEFVAWWLREYKFDQNELDKATNKLNEIVTIKILEKGKPLPGIEHILNFFQSLHFKIGLATSSPLNIAEAVTTMLGINKVMQVKTSAEHLAYGKPHPEVYLACAKALESSPLECICFEDSVNGMIAAKAARMKCVVVPSYDQQKNDKWSLADLKISSLSNFSELHINLLNR